jgi:hypothetical protein
MTEREAFEAWWKNPSVSEGVMWAAERACWNTWQEAWQAATLIERERCAQIAERHYIPGHSVAGPDFAKMCAAAIRKGEA